ncbi:MAG: hypothetical protein ACTSUN_01315 [Promethearchaeota archaeon]
MLQWKEKANESHLIEIYIELKAKVPFVVQQKASGGFKSPKVM